MHMPKRPTWLGGKKEETGPHVITPKDKMEQMRRLVRTPRR